MVQRFKVTETKREHVLHLELSGVLDEDARLPIVNTDYFKELVFDLNGLTSINSVGIRTWMNWIGPLIKAGAKIELERIPAFIVFKFNLMKGFFPTGAKVKSLYFAYSCMACDKDINVLADVSNYVPGKEVVNLAELRKRECGQPNCELESEDEDSKYLAFMFRK